MKIAGVLKRFVLPRRAGLRIGRSRLREECDSVYSLVKNTRCPVLPGLAFSRPKKKQI